ncbi:MAG: discoidin domain-containing protein [Janthinobacterium lividum]
MQNSLRLYLPWLVTLLLLTAKPVLAQNLALNKTATTSSTPAQAAANALDGNGNTRWESPASDAQSITVDLGSVQTIDRIRLTWENAYGKNFTLDVSSDNVTWKTVVTVTNNATTANEYSSLATSGRYVRMNGTLRATQYGYSLYEFEVFNYSYNTANNLSNGKSGVASSTQGGYPASQGLDNDNTTRWGSAYQDSATVYVDLRGTATISRVYLIWEVAYGKDFKVEVSNDAITWKSVAKVSNNSLRYTELALNTTGRYVRMHGLTRGTTYGYSLYELQVYGTITPLPVTLTSFSATPQGTGVAVNWGTASEKNNAGFEVERSANGTDFAKLTTVAGTGTTQNSHTYSYLDAAPLSTISYYRLKQIDLDGTVAYSPVVAVQPAATSIAALSIYPNPTADRATVAWETPIAGAGRWYLTNNTGQVVHAEALSGELTTTLALDLQAYPAGSYVLTVEAGGQVVRRGRMQKVN